jgi:hypothetical protein
MILCPKCDSVGDYTLTTLDDKCSVCGTIPRHYKPGKPLLPHQERVITERNELNIKINALDKFINHTDAYYELSTVEQQRLVSQLEIMHRYSSIFTQRINDFS